MTEAWYCERQLFSQDAIRAFPWNTPRLDCRATYVFEGKKKPSSKWLKLQDDEKARRDCKATCVTALAPSQDSLVITH